MDESLRVLGCMVFSAILMAIPILCTILWFYKENWWFLALLLTFCTVGEYMLLVSNFVMGRTR